MRHASAPVALGLGLTVLASMLFGPRAAGEAPPLTNEDVVRMVASGRPEPEIVTSIERADRTDFELDPEMRGELSRAGVSERILRAMQARQAQVGVHAPPPEPLPPFAPKGTLEFLFLPPESAIKNQQKPVFTVVRRTPRWAMQQLGMPERTEVEDLALFFLCASPEHVPDHWADRTPLKDFVRHELLAFRPGSRPGKEKGFEVLFLDPPAAHPVEVPAGVHTVVVGVAAKAGPDWHVLRSDQRRGVEVGAAGVTRMRIRLAGRLAGSRRKGFRSEAELVIEKVESPSEGV